ncbi:heavy-metal-associated domain-containing protein [Leptotrichia sp. oral taxon 847]|uniref:heavy-metal-associated domain-containing protein n=1 Tax=Leptotrichia sp. oral taxon 847 TaxID=1785996 RepID=UPI000767F0AD|nr:heavy metal-associated domain-containing protein [Leptotrichia sp. oral taxon 847]AMD95024.1 heavy metal transporter [Leptotrichia sp. oral taxon 847]
MIKKLVEIDGMHCEHCQKKVEDTLYSIPEVEEVTVSLVEKNAKITLNEEVNDMIIANLINAAGYKVKNVTEITE